MRQPPDTGREDDFRLCTPDSILRSDILAVIEAQATQPDQCMKLEKALVMACDVGQAM